MKIEAKITKTFSGGSVKAIADVTLDDAIIIHGVKLVEGQNGLFASMPSDRWQDKDGNVRHTDIVRPADADTRDNFNRIVCAAYNAHTQSAEPGTGMSM